MADCEPFPFIRQDDLGKYCIDELAAKKIANIHKSLVVVVISGKMRTGKSFLMNALANISKESSNAENCVENPNTKMDEKTMETSKDELKGFSVSPDVAAHTKGIWAWPIDHPLDNGKCLLLLDTEGLGDVGRQHHKDETWLSVIALTLASVYIWNVNGVIDTGNLEQLCFLTKMTEHIQTKVDNEGFDKNLLPQFVICIRNFQLKLENNDPNSAADDYVRDILQKKIPDTSESWKVGKFINHNFQNRKCFTFPRPKKCKNKHENPLKERNEKFHDSIKTFSEYILKNGNVKHTNGVVFNGRVFVNTAMKYFEAHQEDKIAVGYKISSQVGEIENTIAKENALQLYTNQIECVIGGPPLSIKDLSNHHLRFQKNSIKFFHQKSILDCEHKQEIELLKKISESFRKYVTLNSEKSDRKSQDRLKTLHEDIKNKIVNEEFFKPGGFKKYEKMMTQLENDYHKTASLGDQMHEVYSRFMQDNDDWLRVANADKDCSGEKQKIADKISKDKQKYKNKAAEMKTNIDGYIRDVENCQGETTHGLFVEKAAIVQSITGLDMSKEKKNHKDILKIFGIACLGVLSSPFILAAAIITLPVLPIVLPILYATDAFEDNPEEKNTN